MDIENTKTKPTRETLLLFLNSVRSSVDDLDAEYSKLTEDHESRIRRQYNQLVSNLNVPDVVTKMFQSGKLTAKEHEHIRQFYCTQIRASEELLNIVIVKSRDVYECFLESLKGTKQHHVYQMLTSDEQSVCIGEQTVSEHSRLIRQNYVWLTESLDPDSGLLSTLYANEVLNQREYGQVAFEMNRFVKNEMLLSIISRKSVEDFRKFIIALNVTSQGHIANRLTDTPVGDGDQNVTATVNKRFPTRCSDSFEKRIPPKLPHKPSFLRKPMAINPKPLLELKIHPCKPNRREIKQNFSKHEMMKRRSVEHLESKFRELRNELQTEVSAKICLIHQRTSKVSIWKISFSKILEESRNFKRQNMIQAKAAEENCERLKQEMFATKKQQREIQEAAYVLEDILNLTKSENKNLLEKLVASEFNLEGLSALNKEKQQEVSEKASIIEKLESQVKNSEIKIMKTEELLTRTKDQLFENNAALKETTKMLEETEVKLNEFEVKQRVTENYIGTLKLLNQRKQQEIREKLIKIEKLQSQTIQSEEQLKQLMNAEEKFKVNELDLKSTTAKLRETQKRLKETETTLKEFVANPVVTKKGTDNLRTEDVEAKLLDLQQNFEKDRKAWTEERQQLIRHIQELQQDSSEKDHLKEKTQEYRRMIDELQDQYKSDPVLVHTIRIQSGRKKKLNIFWFVKKRTNSVEEEEMLLLGMTILDNELFLVNRDSQKVEVYDSARFSFSRRWNLKELMYPVDITSCKRNKCLYIFHCMDGDTPGEILRVDPNGTLIRKWSTGDDRGWGLSVTGESNVIFTVSEKNKFNEYSPDGQLIREINLSSHQGIRYPYHAIKLANGHFLVCHGKNKDDLHRVCVVDANGKLQKSFDGKLGSSIGQLDTPVYLSVDENGFVMVADCNNSRILLLNSDLEFKREILSKEIHGLRSLRRPSRILLDESNGRLFLADNASNSEGRILIFVVNKLGLGI